MHFPPLKVRIIIKLKCFQKKHCYTLKNDPQLKDSIPKEPMMVYRRSRALKNTLAPSDIRKTLRKRPKQKIMDQFTWGSFRCNQSRCKCCENISNRIQTFRSTNTQEVFQIKQHLTCESLFVIYLLECKCNFQYIGRTCQMI